MGAPLSSRTPRAASVKRALPLSVAYEASAGVGRAKRRRAGAVGGREALDQDAIGAEEKEGEEATAVTTRGVGNCPLPPPALLRGENASSSSRFAGVSWDRSRKKWKASKHLVLAGTRQQKRLFLGYYANEDDAARAVADYVEQGTVPERKVQSSRFRGVSWCKQTKKWTSRITDDGRKTRLG